MRGRVLQPVQYEGIDQLCFQCGRMGHLVSACPLSSVSGGTRESEVAGARQAGGALPTGHPLARTWAGTVAEPVPLPVVVEDVPVLSADVSTGTGGCASGEVGAPSQAPGVVETLPDQEVAPVDVAQEGDSEAGEWRQVDRRRRRTPPRRHGRDHPYGSQGAFEGRRAWRPPVPQERQRRSSPEGTSVRPASGTTTASPSLPSASERGQATLRAGHIAVDPRRPASTRSLVAFSEGQSSGSGVVDTSGGQGVQETSEVQGLELRKRQKGETDVGSGGGAPPLVG